MKIIVDAFGGDNAPLEIIKGCAMAVEKFEDVEIILTGDEETIRKVSEENELSLERIEIVHAPDVIEMSDHPTELMKSKKNSSMAVGLRLLAGTPQHLVPRLAPAAEPLDDRNHDEVDVGGLLVPVKDGGDDVLLSPCLASPVHRFVHPLFQPLFVQAVQGLRRTGQDDFECGVLARTELLDVGLLDTVPDGLVDGAHLRLSGERIDVRTGDQFAIQHGLRRVSIVGRPGLDDLFSVLVPDIDTEDVPLQHGGNRLCFLNVDDYVLFHIIC